MAGKNHLISLCSVVLLVFPSFSWAYSFQLTETEFRTWPAYCKVVYLRTQVGGQSTFSSLVSQRDFDAATAMLGNERYGDGGVHHLCAGQKWLERAKNESDPEKKNFQLERAKTETEYTLQKTQPGRSSFVLAATQMASILFERGDQSKALDLLNKILLQSSEDPMPYIVKAGMHYKRQEYYLARDVLVAGDRVLDGASRDIHYNLGVVLIKLGEPESAVEHAYMAYEMGYPLPGLKRKLERLGYWGLDN